MRKPKNTQKGRNNNKHNFKSYSDDQEYDHYNKRTKHIKNDKKKDRNNNDEW